MRISDWSSDVCSSDLPFDKLRANGSYLTHDALFDPLRHFVESDTLGFGKDGRDNDELKGHRGGDDDEGRAGRPGDEHRKDPGDQRVRTPVRARRERADRKSAMEGKGV